MPEFKFKCTLCRIELSVEDEKFSEPVICPKCITPLSRISPSGFVEGSMIGSATLTHLIKSSASGELWMGEQGEFKRKVMVKLLSHEQAKDEVLLSRFAREAKNIAKLDHPNITKWVNYGNNQGFYYIITAYIEHGLSLKEYIEESSGISENNALKVVYKIADALDYAWKTHTLVHRNIEPSNILLNASLSNVLLIDFSHAKMMQEDVTLTMGCHCAGASSYMSQELVKRCADIDCRADIYSLGITFYYMLAGRIPFDGTNADEIIPARMNQRCLPISDLRSKLSADCLNILNNMTAFSREERYQNWNELKLDIVRFLNMQKTTSGLTVEKIKSVQHYLGGSFPSYS